MQSKAKTVQAYLAELPSDRREELSTVRDVILKNLPEGYQEIMDFGMITYSIPLSRYPETYNGKPLMMAALASQKNYVSLYLMCVYGDEKIRDWFEKSWKATGKKLDAGKSCIRFKKAEDLALNVIGEMIAKVSVEKYIAYYEKVHKK